MILDKRELPQPLIEISKFNPQQRNPMILQYSVEQLKLVRDYADAHPMKVLDVIDGVVQPAGDTPGHVLILDSGLKLVYSVETDQPRGPSRHISISEGDPEKLPHPDVVLVLAQEMGFRPNLNDGSVWLDDSTNSVNWVQTLEPPTVH